MSYLPLIFEQMFPRLVRRPYFYYNRPWTVIYQYNDEIAEQSKEKQTNCSTSNKVSVDDENGFKVSLNVKNYSPNEISVKSIDDNIIVIEAKHEERQDEQGGFISRQFTRRYALPKEYNVKDIISTLSSDGILTVKAPPIVKNSIENKIRNIPIQFTDETSSVTDKDTDKKQLDDQSIKEQENIDKKE